MLFYVVLLLRQRHFALGLGVGVGRRVFQHGQLILQTCQHRLLLLEIGERSRFGVLRCTGTVAVGVLFAVLVERQLARSIAELCELAAEPFEHGLLLSQVGQRGFFVAVMNLAG